VARFLDGLAGSAFLSVAGGTVGDMFGKHVIPSHTSPPPYFSDAIIGALSAYDGLHGQSVRRPRGRTPDSRVYC